MNEKEGKKKLPAFNASIQCGPFYQDVMFHFGDTKLLYRTIEKYFDKEKAEEVMDDIKESEETTLGKTIDLGLGQLVYLKELPSNETGFSILAHEIFHVVFMMTKKMGIDYSSEGEEVYAYLTQFLTESILREYHKISK